MGWAAKLLALFVGLFLLASPLWPMGLLSMILLAASLRPRGRGRAAGEATSGRRISLRAVLGLVLLLLSAIAFSSGGAASQWVFLIAGGALLSWPALSQVLPLTEVVPVPDSILLRSKYFPLAWWSLAELKPGAEQFPRAAASFAGTLLVFTDTGRTFLAASCLAVGRKEAEDRLLGVFRGSQPAGRPGAYLLPLDSGAAEEALRMKLARARVPKGDLTEYAPAFSGLFVLECTRGRVGRAGAFEVLGGQGVARVPARGAETAGSPLVWEVLEAVGKRTRWPDPDGFSNLLDSMAATRGVPVGERVRELVSSGGRLTIQSLSGEQVQTSRPQFRAIVSIYS
jgi:hypothetical protein